MQSSRKPCASVGIDANLSEPVDSTRQKNFLDKPNASAYFVSVNRNQLISEAARLLGSARSDRKAKTSAENGKKGGRPRKSKKTKGKAA